MYKTAHERTARRFFEYIWLVIPIYGKFTVLQKLFVFFFLGLSMTRDLVPMD